MFTIDYQPLHIMVAISMLCDLQETVENKLKSLLVTIKLVLQQRESQRMVDGIDCSQTSKKKMLICLTITNT